MDSVNIYIPKISHNDSARELVCCWAELDLVSLHESPDMFMWMESPGNILLFDYDLLRDFTLPSYNIGLFGNEFPSGNKNNKKWIFWGRHPKTLHSFFEGSEKQPTSKRQIQSFFAGKIENNTQHSNRLQHKIDWGRYIEDFSIVYGVQTSYKYTHLEYLHKMSQSKFSLHLPGYGPKCNREVEAAATGSIPIVTQGVDVDYFDHWEENVNYLRLQSESDFERIYNTDNTLLEQIQDNNYRWYEKNCSPMGSFDTTQRIIGDMLYE